MSKLIPSYDEQAARIKVLEAALEVRIAVLERAMMAAEDDYQKRTKENRRLLAEISIKEKKCQP
jgi:hypothetical protein